MARTAYTEKPKLRITKKEDQFEALLDLPGVSKDEIEIEYKNNVLTLSATPKKVEDRREPWYREFKPKCYERAFELSNDIKADALEAHLENGQLRLVLPISKTAVKRVEVIGK